MPQNREKSAQNCGSYVQPATGGPAVPNLVQLADAPKQEEIFPKLWFLYNMHLPVRLLLNERLQCSIYNAYNVCYLYQVVLSPNPKM